jgi:ferredoxin-type protein NapG
MADDGDSRQLPRRHFIGVLAAGAVGATGFAFGSGGRPLPGITLRPPGAVPEDAFSAACARCFRCGNACPNACIQFHGPEAGLERAYTPFIRARARGCTLCGECAEVCPTGALRPFEVSKDGWVRSVQMGKARVNEGMCYSFHGRTCGACYRACPLAGRAMTIGLYETPHVHAGQCVGCGLCEQACLHLPQAIRVIPVERRAAEEEA